MSEFKAECRKWTMRTSVLLVTLIAGEVSILGCLLYRKNSDTANDLSFLVIVLAVIWLNWFALQFSNFQLVRCGPQNVRMQNAPALINRPDFLIRLANHIIVNWSAIFSTLIAAWTIDGRTLPTVLVWASVWATLLVWLGFNLLHRQFNRVRNIVMTTALAATALSASAWLLAQLE